MSADELPPLSAAKVARRAGRAAPIRARGNALHALGVQTSYDEPWVSGCSRCRSILASLIHVEGELRHLARQASSQSERRPDGPTARVLADIVAMRAELRELRELLTSHEHDGDEPAVEVD